MSQKVLIADREAFFAEALATAMAEHTRIDVIGWTTDEIEAEQIVAQEAPDIVLAGVDGETGAVERWIRRIAGRARVIILTRASVGDSLLQAAAGGASGIVGHDLGIATLVDLLAGSVDGRFVVDPRRLGDNLRRAARPASVMGVDAAGLERLTAREHQVLRLLASGLDNAGMARELHLSTHTIRTHIGNILRKLEVNSRAQAARLLLNSHDTSRPGVLHIRGPDLAPP